MASVPLPLDQLLQRSDLWRGDASPRSTPAVQPSGFAALDAALPGGGWPSGALTELLPAQAGIGEISLLLPALARLDPGLGPISLVAPPAEPCARAWREGGLDLARLLIVRASARDASWACEQLLASGALGALLAWLPEADARSLRRLQVAATGRCSLAFILRPATQAGQSSPAPLRLRLSSAATGLAVQLIKRRGPPLAQTLLLPVARPLAWARAAALCPVTPPAAGPRRQPVSSR